MIIDDQSGMDSIYDKWTEHGLSKSIEWNGRSLVLLEGDFRIQEDLVNKIAFLFDGNTVHSHFCRNNSDGILLLDRMETQA